MPRYKVGDMSLLSEFSQTYVNGVDTHNVTIAYVGNPPALVKLNTKKFFLCLLNSN
jgi:hypothetical protein